MRDDQEKKTMNERIRAFYKQSGGPNNPQIETIIEKHLLYGKDHGVPGKRETFKDAMLEVFLDDYSTKDIVMWLLKAKYDISDRWQELIVGKTMDQIAAAEEMTSDKEPSVSDNIKLAQLEQRLVKLENNIGKIVTLLEDANNSQNNNESMTNRIIRSQGF